MHLLYRVYMLSKAYNISMANMGAPLPASSLVPSELLLETNQAVFVVVIKHDFTLAMCCSEFSSCR